MRVMVLRIIGISVPCLLVLGVLGGVALAATFEGTDGPDVISGTEEADVIRAKGGDDYARGERGGSDLGEGDLLDGGERDDRLYGNEGGDEMRGGPGKDYLQGNVGGDTLYGGKGRDKLMGGSQSDTVFGGDGDDIIRTTSRGDHRGEDRHGECPVGPIRNTG